jgi:hypothetical protein
MKIDEYYNQLRDLNISEKGGWATFHYGVFSNIINDNDYKNVAEIGAGYGTHSRYILTNNPNIKQLIIIDPMKWYENDGFANDINNQEPINKKNNFDSLFDLINEDLLKISNKFKWIRKESSNITNEDISDNSLDAIFIDGDHSYTAVFNDLKLYWNKVRSGGQLLGDDYWMDQVAKAVDDFSNLVNIKYDFLYKPGTNYKIYRFFKP